MNDLFHIKTETRTCRQCSNRFTTLLSEYSSKMLQCCKYKRGKNNAGYKTIKVTNPACILFEQKNIKKK